MLTYRGGLDGVVMEQVDEFSSFEWTQAQGGTAGPSVDLTHTMEPLVSEGKDLRGVNLMGAELAGVDFRGANLEGAKLFKANLKGADLSSANLIDAELTGADLTGANLEEANMSRVGLGMARLTRARLFRTTLDFSTLTGADLEQADLRCVSLREARIREANLRKADLTGADLQEADLSGSHVEKATFQNANMRRATIRYVAGFEQANWVGADLRDVDFSGAYLLRRFAMDQNYIKEFREKSKMSELVYHLWWISSDCGRSISRWLILIGFVTLVFGGLYMHVDIDYGVHEPAWFTPFYYSIVTMTSLGYGDIIPRSAIAQCIAVVQVLLGYIMLGGLLSIFANKLARRAE